MKSNIQLDKKTIILLSSAVCVGMVSVIFIWPLFAKVSVVSMEVKTLDEQLAGFRDVLQSSSKFSREKKFMARDEVSKAINDIISIGADSNINFLSTNPQPIQELEGSKNPILPIHMEAQSTYKDFGMFLGALENLSKNVVVVRQFSIDRRQEILPKIYTELIVDIYLKEGEGG